MAVSFNVPASPQRDINVIDTFLGVDFTSAPDIVDITRSPNALNMVRSVPGKVRKAMGYSLYKQIPSAYLKGEPIVSVYRTANNHTVYSFETYFLIEQRTPDATLYFKMGEDGRTYRCNWVGAYGDGCIIGYERKSPSYTKKDYQIAFIGIPFDPYVPLVSISRNPNGGGTPYESLNLLDGRFIDSFLGTATDKIYQLSHSALDPSVVTVSKLTNSGVWVQLERDQDYSFDSAYGRIIFTEAPGVSPVTGEDNIRVEAKLGTPYWGDELAQSTCVYSYGSNGKGSYLVVGGGTNANKFWFSALNRLNYFPDTNYVLAGNNSSSIVAFGTVNDYLAVFKDEADRETNTILFESATLESGQEYFRSVTSLQSDYIISPNSIRYMNGELIYLSKNGINAISQITNSTERISVKRSYYLDGKLNNEPLEDRQKAVSALFNGMYILMIKGKLYILDGEQPVYNSSTNQFFDKQYCAFYREMNSDVVGLYSEGEDLFIVFSNGQIHKFFKDVDDIYSYADNGEAIPCYWETPDLVGKLFYKNKTLRYIAVKCGASIATSLKLWVMERGLWNLIKEDHVFGNYFQFTKIIFSKFSFSTDKTQRICRAKARVKKVDKFRLKISNDELNEPLTLSSIGFEFVESGNYKG